MKITYALLVTILSLFFTGCASQLNNSNTLNVKIIADKITTPLSVHFFTLKSDSVFKRLDYFELVDSKHVNWNNELLNHAKTILRPGHTEIFQAPVTPQMQYYALVIGFKDVKNNDNWRYIRQVPSGGVNVALQLNQDSYGVASASQGSNGFSSSRTVQSVSSKSMNYLESKTSPHVTKLGGDVSSKATAGTGNIVNTIENRLIDRSVDSILNRMFN